MVRGHAGRCEVIGEGPKRLGPPQPSGGDRVTHQGLQFFGTRRAAQRGIAAEPFQRVVDDLPDQVLVLGVQVMHSHRREARAGPALPYLRVLYLFSADEQRHG